MGISRRIKHILGIHSDVEITRAVAKEAPVRAARQQLRRVDSILKPLQVAEDRMLADLVRADQQRTQRGRH